MLDFAREEIRQRIAFALPNFEAALPKTSDADDYQAAMRWLGIRAGQDAVNDVIAKAVLQARKAGVGDLPAGKDGEPDGWNIPIGTTGLGELVTRGGEKFLGPILTTNFDPLISLAIRKSGGRAGRRVLTADGTLAGAAEDEDGICNVVHLHGYWRDSETLHTQAQLTNPRPKLKASLQRLLVAQKRTLIVAAYGGWDDVFTESLVDLMNDEQAKLDVIWCFYENDPVKVEQKYSKLLKAVAPAIVLNRFRAFGGIDCHSIFTEILSTKRGMSSPTAVAPVVSSPLAGWELIDAAYLKSLPGLNQDEVIRYFDGAVPTWRHAVSPAIPRRQAVADLAKRLAAFQPGKGICTMQLIRAAGGEGKTTLLLQAASDAAHGGNWTVLWRPSPHLRLLPEHLVKLDASKQWLVVADDAENLVDDLKECARQLHAAGRSNVYFLLAARDADWWGSFGDNPAWENWLNAWVSKRKAIILRGINPDDALLVVEAWTKCGTDGLRELAKLPATADQVNALVNEVQDAVNKQDDQERRHNPVEGSFFGGLLAVRFGQNGLQAHVRAFLNRLKGDPIEGSNRTLYDALLYVAACHAVGIPGIDENVLADLVGVPREWVQTLVVNPLGEEAAAVRSAGHVLTRHSKVAGAILITAEQDLGADVAEIWSAVVRQTVVTSKNLLLNREWFPAIVHAGPRLQNILPKQFSEQRRIEIAIAAAKADVMAEHNRLSALVDLGNTYRNAGLITDAINLFRENLVHVSSKIDFDIGSRSYWYEWGGCEGRSGNTRQHALQSAWVCGLSLSDFIEAGISDRQIRLSCAGTGVAFGMLAQARQDCPFALGRRATAYIGLLSISTSNPDEKGARFFNADHREADKIGTPYPKSVEEAIIWLTNGVAQAGREIQDLFLKALLKPEQASFKMLQQLLNATPPPTRQAKRTTQPPATQAKHIDDTKPLQLGSKLDEQIRAGIERVASEAWEAAASAAPEDRLRIAKQEAIRLIPKLSPSIRKQVNQHFTSEKWQPLIIREPKV
jgi:hypothetical protein